MIGIYIVIALAAILALAEIILNFAEIAAFFRFSYELLQEGHYAEAIFGAVIAVVMIIALLMPAVKEMRKNKSQKK